MEHCRINTSMFKLRSQIPHTITQMYYPCHRRQSSKMFCLQIHLSLTFWLLLLSKFQVSLRWHTKKGFRFRVLDRHWYVQSSNSGWHDRISYCNPKSKELVDEARSCSYKVEIRWTQGGDPQQSTYLLCLHFLCMCLYIAVITPDRASHMNTKRHDTVIIHCPSCESFPL